MATIDQRSTAARAAPTKTAMRRQPGPMGEAGRAAGGRLKVLFAASEMAPLVKTGGLGDVAGSLPAALAGLGVDVRVLLPAYPAVLEALQLGPGGRAPRVVVGSVPALAALPAAQLLAARSPQGVELLLVHCPVLYDRPGNPYLGPDGRDWNDNDLRFGLFSHVAALLGGPQSPLVWRPDVVHAHDWQAGLAPVYLAYSGAQRAASVITIHNLAYQGIFGAEHLARLALPARSFSIDGVEYYGKLSFLKGGLACADAITTVSPTYAREICGAALGFGLQGLLGTRSQVLSGILNGVDTDYWNPATDPHLAQRYDAERLAGKRANKRALQATLGLAPDDNLLLGMVTRLVEQKGVDLVADLAETLVGLPVQLAIEGTGDRALEQRLLALARRHPRQIAVRVAFDEPLAHLIEAGADAFLMPSRFEPCGMNQMFSQRYGTLPIVHRTGGLADSVTDASAEALAAGTATGFSFTPASAAALLEAIGRAQALYADHATWERLQRNAMALDVSWQASAAKYLELYRRVTAAA
jgi:starch synthase